MDGDDLGFVYFIRAGFDGPVKIGYSRNVESRLKQLQTGHAARLHVLRAVPGDVALERELHARHAPHRLHGEWFRPHADVLRCAAEIEGRRPMAPTPAPRPAPTPPRGTPMPPAELAAAARACLADLRQRPKPPAPQPYVAPAWLQRARLLALPVHPRLTALSARARELHAHALLDHTNPSGWASPSEALELNDRHGSNVPALLQELRAAGLATFEGYTGLNGIRFNLPAQIDQAAALAAGAVP